LTGRPLRVSFLLFTSDIFPESYRIEEALQHYSTDIKHEIVIQFSSRCFLSRDPNSEFDASNDLFLRSNGITVKETSNSEETTMDTMFSIFDPRTHLKVARILFKKETLLERARPFLQSLNASIANAIAALQLTQALKVIEAQAREITTIMKSLNQGVCLIQPDLTLKASYSAALETMVDHRPIHGSHLIRQVLKDFKMSSESLSILSSTLEASLGENPLAFEINKDQLPSECTGPDNQIYELDWVPILDTNHLVCDVLLSFHDVSHIRQFQHNAKLHQRMTHLLELVLDLEESALESHLNDLKQLENEILKHSFSDWRSLQVIQHLKQKLHTQKGISRSLKFQEISSCIHGMEQLLHDQNETLNTPEFELAFEKFMKDMGTELQKLSHLRNEIHYVYFEKLKRGQNKKISSQLQHKWNIVGKWLEASSKDLNLVRLKTLWDPQIVLFKYVLSGLKAAVEDAAHQITKPCPELRIQGNEDFLIPESLAKNLYQILIHCLRNAVDHGCNSPTEHWISLSYESIENHLEITLIDSGKGFNLELLSQKIGPSAANLSDIELAQWIFKENLSTNPFSSTKNPPFSYRHSGQLIFFCILQHDFFESIFRQIIVRQK